MLPPMQQKSPVKMGFLDNIDNIIKYIHRLEASFGFLIYALECV